MYLHHYYSDLFDTVVAVVVAVVVDTDVVVFVAADNYSDILCFVASVVCIS